MNIIGIILIIVFSIFCVLLFGVFVYLRNMWTAWCTFSAMFEKIPKMEDLKQFMEYAKSVLAKEESNEDSD